jgi:uracil-DNA glycosylase family 4
MGRSDGPLETETPPLQTPKEPSSLEELTRRIVQCRLCPRLVRWREQAAQRRPKRYANWEYWARPVPGFGDPEARLLVLGLAPAAHGANRTGRMFTGDRSGEWLFRALHRQGFANQPRSERREDGLQLKDAYISAVLRCAPPQNKPLGEELARCRQYLVWELSLLTRLRVVVALGRIAFETLKRLSSPRGSLRCPFRHGAEYRLPSGLWLIASYHPSQQNTFTGKLTEPMFDAIFARAKELLESLLG